MRPCRLCGRERPAFTPCVACTEDLAQKAVSAVFARTAPDPSLICYCGQLREQCGHLEVV